MCVGGGGQSVHAPYALTWQVEPAAEPRECIWANMHLPAWQRSIRQPTVYVITFLLIVFYMIPIAAISTLASLENLEKIAPFIKTIVQIKALNSILQVSLPRLTSMNSLLHRLLFSTALFPLLKTDALHDLMYFPVENIVAFSASSLS